MARGGLVAAAAAAGAAMAGDYRGRGHVRALRFLHRRRVGAGAVQRRIIVPFPPKRNVFKESCPGGHLDCSDGVLLLLLLSHLQHPVDGVVRYCFQVFGTPGG